jgi:hypothetical protein
MECPNPIVTVGENVVEFVAGHWLDIGIGTIGSIPSLDGGGELPNGTLIDLSRGESDCGAGPVDC